MAKTDHILFEGKTDPIEFYKNSLYFTGEQEDQIHLFRYSVGAKTTEAITLKDPTENIIPDLQTYFVESLIANDYYDFPPDMDVLSDSGFFVLRKIYGEEYKYYIVELDTQQLQPLEPPPNLLAWPAVWSRPDHLLYWTSAEGSLYVASTLDPNPVKLNTYKFSSPKTLTGPQMAIAPSKTGTSLKIGLFYLSNDGATLIAPVLPETFYVHHLKTGSVSSIATLATFTVANKQHTARIEISQNGQWILLSETVKGPSYASYQPYAYAIYQQVILPTDLSSKTPLPISKFPYQGWVFEPSNIKDEWGYYIEHDTATVWKVNLNTSAKIKIAEIEALNSKEIVDKKLSLRPINNKLKKFILRTDSCKELSTTLRSCASTLYELDPATDTLTQMVP